jgi:putative oxidoreductase
MFKQFITTQVQDFTPFILRLTLGFVTLPHGAQKLVGAFGGFGFTGTMQYFTETMHIPYFVALLIVLGESLGAIALILGFFTRFMAASIGIIMSGAVFLVHLQHGFFMNWFANQKGEGYEYFLLALGIATVLTLKGGGKWSIDGFLQKKMDS